MIGLLTIKRTSKYISIIIMVQLLLLSFLSFPNILETIRHLILISFITLLLLLYFTAIIYRHIVLLCCYYYTYCYYLLSYIYYYVALLFMTHFRYPAHYCSSLCLISTVNTVNKRLLFTSSATAQGFRQQRQGRKQ